VSKGDSKFGSKESTTDNNDMGVLLSDAVELSKIIDSSESSNILYVGLVGQVLGRASSGQQNLERVAKNH
jgi:hypothetical protein